MSILVVGRILIVMHGKSELSKHKAACYDYPDLEKLINMKLVWV